MATVPPTSAPPSPRRLVRSRDDRMIAGIAGGVADTYGYDVALVRIAFVVATLITAGAGIVAYGVAWLVVPEDPETDRPGSDRLAGAERDPRRTHRLWIGIALLAIGIKALLDRLDFAGDLDNLFWPFALIGGGAAILLLRHPATETPDDPGASIEVVRQPRSTHLPEEPAQLVGEVVPPEPVEPPTTAYPQHGPWPAPPKPPAPPWVPRPHVPRERSVLTRLTWSALLFLAGGAWLLSLTGAARVDVAFVTAIAIGIVGVALLVGTWFGRTRTLVVLGLVLVTLGAGFSQIDVPLRGGIGERVYEPLSTSAVAGEYELAIGHLQIDLSRVEFSGRTVRINATTGVGQIEIFVPPSVGVDVTGRADIGNVSLLDAPEVDGLDADLHYESGDSSEGLIVIDARVGVGEVKVRRSATVAVREAVLR